MSELTHKDLKWFKLANSNPQPGFYLFKQRFLKRFATPDGYDLQTIIRDCYTCDGSGLYAGFEKCNRCGGDGIYRTDKNWLARYDLGGATYHIPEPNAWSLNGGKYPDPKKEYEGKLTHPSVDSKVARRAFYRLLLRHEPVTFYHIVIGMIRDGMSMYRVRLSWKLIRLRNVLDLFPANPDKDVPF